MHAKTTIAPQVQCPSCGKKAFFFVGIQRGYGFAPDMELWTCEGCGSTFSGAVVKPTSGTKNGL